MLKDYSLTLALKELRLPLIHRYWKDYAQQAQNESWAYAKYLSTLCELEVNEREQKRLKRYTSESKLPVTKTLELFDFKAASFIPAPAIYALAENQQWIKDAHNLILFGPSGVGKTHLACAIGHALIAQGVRVFYSCTTALVQRMQQAKKELKLYEFIAKLSKYQLLILDDLSYVKKDDVESCVLFELITYRYETGSLIITANEPFSQWEKVFPDSTMTVAATDRLVHHAKIINLQGESFRRAQKQGVKKIHE
jgi:DNA replication protein DnaC